MPWLRLTLLALLGVWFAWALTTPGGPSARVDSVIARIRGDVEQATADPQLRRAADALDAAFRRDGRYPALTEEQVRDDPAFGIGVGVEVSLCSARHVVLVGLSGRGPVSRLLVDGAVVGDVDGRQPCPSDPDRPSPWR